MRTEKCAFLCLLLVLSTLGPIVEAKRSFGRGGGSHSYPKSGGLSGGGSGSHGYPSSRPGGLSGSGGHGYPHSGGMSGSGGSHGYPPSGGLSGGGSGGSHSYPASTGLSGGSSYGNHRPNTNNYPPNRGGAGGSHYPYRYEPPKQITYAPVHGAVPQSYPVYHGPPPNYVYQYKDSGSKYGTLLAGLALLNLGTFAGTAYLASKSHSDYKPQPGEVCYFGVKKDNGNFEETKIDCKLISSFIYIEEEKIKQAGTNTTSVTTTVTNITTVNGVANTPVNPLNETVSNPLYEMLPNGTLVPVNSTNTNHLNTTISAVPPINGTSTTTVVVTNTTTVTDALSAKGKPVEVTPGMQCFMRRVTPTSQMRKNVPCGLLQTYAEQSLKKNSAIRINPAFSILPIVAIVYVMF